MDDMVKAVSSNPAYKVLTKEEYDILMSKHAGGGGSVALRPKSTAMVIAGRSVHLTTLFPGQA